MICVAFERSLIHNLFLTCTLLSSPSMTTVLRPYSPSPVSAPHPTTTHYMGIHAHDTNPTPPPRMLTWTTHLSSLVLLYAPRTTHRSTRYTPRSNLRYTHQPTRYTPVLSLCHHQHVDLNNPLLLSRSPVCTANYPPVNPLYPPF